MVRQRVRIRYRKQEDLRWLGHRDLARAWERVFRRAGVGLKMSEGFHPKPRLCFPSALAVGVAGVDEVLEAELTEAWSADKLLEILAAHAPGGLIVKSVEPLPPESSPAQVRRMVFELAVPFERRPALAERLARWSREGPHLLDRGEGRKPLDLSDVIEGLWLADGVLRIEVRVTPQGTARPRDLLAAIGLEDLEEQGCYLTRTAVELAP